MGDFVDEGRIVIIEGVDGIGKSMLIDELTDYYLDEGGSVSTWKFPDVELPFGSDLYAMLAVRKYFNPYAFQYGVVSQIFHELPHIYNARENGDIVFIERAFLSIMAYGYAEKIPEPVLRRVVSDVKRYFDYDAMILLTSKSENFPVGIPDLKFVESRTPNDNSEDSVRYKDKWDVTNIINALMKHYARDYRCLKIALDGFRTPEELALITRKYIRNSSFR